MSEDTQNPELDLETLRAEADQLGISYRNNLSAEKLAERIKEHKKQPSANDEGDGEAAETQSASGKESPRQRRLRKQKEARKLVRVIVTCMNPNKREWDGEMFSAGNTLVGTHRKFVPFEKEWHVPQVIFNMMKDRECQVFVTEKDERGREVRRGKQIKEFNIQELPPLTQEELDDLAKRQSMANGTYAA